MATFFSSSPFLVRPLTVTNHFSSSSHPPPPKSPSQPQSSTPSTPLLTTNSSYEQQPATVSVKMQQQRPTTSSINVETTDWIASNLTRRFGLGAGLAWAAFLAVGVISEQLKTREAANTTNVEEEEIVLPNGIRYYELRVGGGASPRPGDLVEIDLRGQVQASGEVFVDTFGREKKPLGLVTGSRPYNKGMCEGIEYALRSMNSGGRRRIVVPPGLGFGDTGADLGTGVQIPPSATLEYIVEVATVSIPLA